MGLQNIWNNKPRGMYLQGEIKINSIKGEGLYDGHLWRGCISGGGGVCTFCIVKT